MSYSQSHPWLVFAFNTSTLAPEFWSQLGAVTAMANQIASMPLLPENFQQVHRLLLVKSALASTAIEDNVTAEQEIRRLEQEGQEAMDYSDVEINNLLALHKETVRPSYLADWRLSEDWLRSTHAKILRDVPAKPNGKVVPGRVRQHNVTVGFYRAPDYSCCPELFDKFFRFFAQSPLWEEIAASHGKYHAALIKAILAHMYLAWIHPFGDGNGRIARLTEFTILAEAGMPMAVGCCLSRYYHKSRPEYYRQLKDSSRLNLAAGWPCAPANFISYAIAGLREILASHIEELLAMQRKIFFQRLLDAKFNSESIQQNRRKELVRAIDETGKDVKQDEMLALNPKVAKFYRVRNEKTLERDLKTLIADGWLFKSGRGLYHSNRKEILDRFQSPQGLS